MKERFDLAINGVRRYLEDNQYSYSTKIGHYRCYHLLDAHLKLTGKEYCVQLAKEWLDGVKDQLCPSTVKAYRKALSRLDDAFYEREIENTMAQYKSHQSYRNLEPWCRTVIDDFLNQPSVSEQSSLNGLRIAIARFLAYVANQGVQGPEGITHKLIVHYNTQDLHRSSPSKDRYNACVRRFLYYLSGNGWVKASIPLTLDKVVLARLVFIDDLIESEKDAFRRANDSHLMAQEFRQKTLQLETMLDQYNYSVSAKKAFRITWKEFFIFLEANDLDYSLEVALAWANHMCRYTVQWKSFRRALMLFEQFRLNGQIDPDLHCTVNDRE